MSSKSYVTKRIKIFYFFKEKSKKRDDIYSRRYIKGRVADENITMIIVTHEMSFAHQISDKVIFMDQGQIVESGTAKQIFDHPQMPRTQQFLARYRGDTDYII